MSSPQIQVGVIVMSPQICISTGCPDCMWSEMNAFKSIIGFTAVFNLWLGVDYAANALKCLGSMGSYGCQGAILPRSNQTSSPPRQLRRLRES
jgi:hypothetical protein